MILLISLSGRLLLSSEIIALGAPIGLEALQISFKTTTKKRPAQTFGLHDERIEGRS